MSRSRNSRSAGPHPWQGRELAVAPSVWQISMPRDAADAVVWAGQEMAAGGATCLAPERLNPWKPLIVEIRNRLNSFPGFVLLQGFPVEELTVQELSTALLTFGTCLGQPVSQTVDGALVGRVEDVGKNASNPTHRGHQTSAGLPFHVDRTDVIALLCVRTAMTGGVSRLASAHAVHNVLLEETPELLDVLYEPLPHDRRGEELPGQSPWLELSIFAEVERALVTRYVRRFIASAMRFPDARRLSDLQLRALDRIDHILARPGFALDMQLAPGDLQLVDNYAIWHGRTAFTDPADPADGRLLLRLWLATSDSPPLPDAWLPLYGSVRPGTVRGGVWAAGAQPDNLGQRVRPLFISDRDVTPVPAQSQ
jgi:hypothetical protein